VQYLYGYLDISLCNFPKHPASGEVLCECVSVCVSVCVCVCVRIVVDQYQVKVKLSLCRVRV